MAELEGVRYEPIGHKVLERLLGSTAREPRIDGYIAQAEQAAKHNIAVATTHDFAFELF